MRYVLLLLLTSCLTEQHIEVRCEPPKVLEDAFVQCLEQYSKITNERLKCEDDLTYYRNKYFEVYRQTNSSYDPVSD